jgi:hypothetical protein
MSNENEEQIEETENEKPNPAEAELALQTQKIEEAQERARKADEARIRAEAERDTIKSITDSRNAQPAPNAQISEEQWKNIEETTGQNRQAYIANANVASQIANNMRAELDKKVAAAEEKAKKAEERLARLEAGLGADSTKRDFYASKPALARYKADVEEFLSDYPESMKSDPKELQRLLGKAETFVKGKVGDKMRTEKSPRLGGNSESSDDIETVELDTSDLRPREAEFVRGLVKSPDQEKRLREVASVSKHGVTLEGDREWNEVNTDIRNQFKNKR